MDGISRMFLDVDAFLGKRSGADDLWAGATAAPIRPDLLAWRLLFDKCKKVDAAPEGAARAWQTLRQNVIEGLRRNVPHDLFPGERQQFERFLAGG